ncbi:MAG: chromosomal replication initiator DnaA [Paracoccus sp. (in: a-proteobacteria)]|mgnify:FL=1|jgi:chromosomal replication initiation ATPase DnaA|uniref:chromosomal replication initiator DnaA n=1 Tax=unclassified Paracoccus (in: a-proteobacteria) TaxID=2688777 RepID=UPI000C62FB87|nr:chromosomal replication initiator DnaA [Paracoccus sp. UBA5162]MAN55391.1 chromosomal replication initiator DnaA [Paracoccus sp. (in: a-proteobacteria)]|tara:strand:- start:3883 stop:4572 length:690 start_codon:yes stop_codon:yes gene_type:complete
MSRQLTLDLTTPPAHARADFLPAPANQAALAMLDSPQAWPQGRMLLIGPEGAGKTHLAAFWAAENGARRLSAASLRPDAADALAADGGALVVEDADHAGFAAGAEQALFHLWNLCGPRDCLLLMTARRAPRDWGLVLPDLRSRMDAMPQVRLGPPDETLLAAVLVKLFADRQLAVPAGLIDWLVLRMDRDLGLARRLVAAIDRAAMAAQGPVTRRMAAEALDILTPAEA